MKNITFIFTQKWVDGIEEGCFVRFPAQNLSEAKSIAYCRWGQLLEGIREDVQGLYCATLSCSMEDTN